MDPRHTATSRREVAKTPVCPLCGGEGVAASRKSHAFRYGSGESAVELTVNVPVRRCDACEFEYLDEAAERLKHEAVYRHLGVLSPGEVRRIRESHRMTRARFAHVTGLGGASLNRWENGLAIQTHGNDRYLRLLARPEIMRRLEEFVASDTPASSASVPTGNRSRTREVRDALLED